MKTSVTWMAKNHVAANLLMGFVLLSGLFALLGTRKETFPEFSLDQVQIQVPYLGAGDVRPGGLKLADLPRTTPEIAAEYPRTRLRPGEIVYAIRGTFGGVELVPDELDGANLSRDVARICPDRGIDPRWLLWAMRSELALEQFRRKAVGTAVTGVNIGDLKKVRLAVPPTLQDQSAIANQIESAVARLDRLASASERQLALLREHRRALITATVPGEMAVPGVAA